MFRVSLTIESMIVPWSVLEVFNTYLPWDEISNTINLEVGSMPQLYHLLKLQMKFSMWNSFVYQRDSYVKFQVILSVAFIDVLMMEVLMRHTFIWSSKMLNNFGNSFFSGHHLLVNHAKFTIFKYVKRSNTHVYHNSTQKMWQAGRIN